MSTTCAQLTLMVPPHCLAHYIIWQYAYKDNNVFYCFFSFAWPFSSFNDNVTVSLLCRRCWNKFRYIISHCDGPFWVFLVNSSRGNKHFGDCTARMTPRCLIPANREAAADTATDANTWRPPSQVSVAPHCLLFLWYLSWRHDVLTVSFTSKKSSTMISECFEC